MADLVGLARRYVALSDELRSFVAESRRRSTQRRRPERPFVNAQRRGGKASQGSRSQLQSRQESQPIGPGHVEAAKLARNRRFSESPSGRPRRVAEMSVRNAGATIDDQREAAQDARQGLGQRKRDGEGWAVERLTPQEVADLLSPVTIAHRALAAPPIYASLARDVAGRHSEPDEPTAAQKAVHAPQRAAQGDGGESNDAQRMGVRLASLRPGSDDRGRAVSACGLALAGPRRAVAGPSGRDRL